MKNSARCILKIGLRKIKTIVFVLLAIIAIISSIQPNKNEQCRTNLDVQIMDFFVDDVFQVANFKGTITNYGESLKQVRIVIGTYDVTGSKCGEAIAMINNIGKNQIVSFTAEGIVQFRGSNDYKIESINTW